MINKGRSPNQRHVTRTHRVDLDWLFQRVNLDLDKIRANELSSGGYFDTRNVHLHAIAFIVDSVANQTTFESNDVRSFSRKPFGRSAEAKHQAMPQVMTQAENIDQIWSQYAQKVLKSGCALRNHLTLEQLSNNEFHCSQHKRDLLAGMLFVQKAEGNLLQVFSHLRS